MTSSDQGILIFGGTFDPPHLAHTKLPPIAAERLGCGRILFIPAALNPLKTEKQPTSAEHRVAMLRLALHNVPDVEIDTLELDRSGPSYTVDTLDEMRRRFGDETKLRLLIGADAALSFERWKDWRRILELAEPAVMPRPPWTRKLLIEEFRKLFDPDWAAYWSAHLVDVPYLDVSATGVRERLDAAADLADLADLLDPAVIEYITEHDLYSARTA